jgi:hypothetical protein
MRFIVDAPHLPSRQSIGDEVGLRSARRRKRRRPPIHVHQSQNGVEASIVVLAVR